MRTEIITAGGYRYVKASYDYQNDKGVIDGLVEKAVGMCGVVNPHAPNGTLRPQDERFNKVLGGLLAENAVLSFLETRATENQKPIDVLDSSFTQEADLSRLGFKQIDLKVGTEAGELDIEIRSSFSYRTSLARLLGVELRDGKGAFSLIGWYTSGNKPREVKKDYYLFVIHHYHPSEIHTRIYDHVELYIAGAASKQTLEEHGEDSSLKQSGARFRIINPLNSVADVVAVVDEILG